MYFASHKYHLIVIFPLICGLVFSDSVVFSCDVKMLVRVTVSVSVQYGLVHARATFRRHLNEHGILSLFQQR